MRVIAVGLAALAVVAPAGATLKPGDRAAVDVSVATLWKAPNLYRAIDRPSLANPVDLSAWNRNLSTTASRVWLDSHVQTQALYGQQVVVLARSGGWAKVAVVDEPDPQDPHGYPGWLPVSQLAHGLRPRRRAGRSPVAEVRAARARTDGAAQLRDEPAARPLERRLPPSSERRTASGRLSASSGR